MKNKLSNLNDHLFLQLERLSDDDLKSEEIEREAKRADAMVAVADQIIRNAAVQIQAAKLASDRGLDPTPYLPTASRLALPAPQPVLEQPEPKPIYEDVGT